MTQPLFAMTPPATLQLVQEQFSPEALQRICGANLPPPQTWQRPLLGPLSEFLSRPGKEFRGRLVDASYCLAGGSGQPPAGLAPLVEVLHAGSLIIDDIEDGSNSRRGAPALHVRHGLPIAMNGGNWLYFLAFDLVERLGVGPHIELALYRWMSRTVFACHYGQGLDLTTQMADVDQQNMLRVVNATTRLKTGALMELSAAIGAIVAGGKSATVTALTSFAAELGVGLQMLDDLGGLMDETRRHDGHEDLINGRPTWPWAWLATELNGGRFSQLQTLARAVEQRNMDPEVLAVEMRRHLGKTARRVVRRHLRSAFSTLRAQIGTHPVLGQLSLEVQRVERSYG